MGMKASEALVAASRWYARLADEHATSRDRQLWQAWHDASAEHREAWRQLESINQQFQEISPDIGLATLGLPSPSRRRAIKHLAGIVAIGILGAYGWRAQPWQELLADYDTAIGERRELVLEDGTRLVLNTDTTINIEYSAGHRLVQLLQGELLIETGHADPQKRPFSVHTRYGRITALGTRYMVRDTQEFSRVSVFEGAVAIRPTDNAQVRITLHPGQRVDFNDETLSQVAVARTTDSAWSKGMLVAYEMLLGDFIKELARYRRGRMQCDPAVQSLQISGAFPLDDIDSILQTLVRTLPVRVESFTRLWTTIRPV